MNAAARKMKNVNRRKIIAGLFAIALVTITVLVYEHFQMKAAQARAQAASSSAPRRTQVHSLGRLEPTGTILQLAPKSGNEGAIVEQLLVAEGDDIAAGTVIAIMDSRARRLAAHMEAQANLEAAEARLQQIKAGAKSGDIDAQQALVQLAEVQGQVASRDLERAKELKARNAISNDVIDQKQWEFDRLQIEQRRSSGLLNSLREIRPVDVAVVEKEVAAAQAAVVRAQSDADASELRAPVAGRVLRIHTHPGEKVADRGILELGDVLHMQAVAEVFEADVAQLEIGMAADIQMDSSDIRMTGRVVEIGNMVARKIVLTNDPVSDTDARVVEVRIDLDANAPPAVARLSNARIEVTIYLDQPQANVGVSGLLKESR